MHIDTTQIDQINQQISELGRMIVSQDFTKEKIAGQIAVIDSRLQAINRTTHEKVARFQAEKEAWEQRLAAKHQAFVDQTGPLIAYAKQLVADGEKLMADRQAGRSEETPVIEMPDVDPEVALQSLATEMSHVETILAQDLELKTARKRRWLLRFTWVFFRFNNLMVKVLSIACIATVGYFAGKLLEPYFLPWAQFLVSIGLALVSGFSLDLLIENISTRFYWKNAERWRYALAKQTELLTTHVLAIQAFELGRNGR